MKAIHTLIMRILAGLLLVISGTPAQASVVIDGTRVIYPSTAQEVTVKLTNHGNSPVLIQSWIDTGNPDALPEKIVTPFVLTPPVNRVNAEESQTLRISGVNTSALRQDRESVYWLNVLEIPPRPQNASGNENYLQLAIRTRIKLFYRPSTLQGNATDAIHQLNWRSTAGTVVITNPTPFYISLDKIIASHNAIPLDMIAPNSQLKINADVPSGSKIIVDWINDYGAQAKHTVIVN